jgi:hypothetical protein
MVAASSSKGKNEIETCVAFREQIEAGRLYLIRVFID